VNTGMGLKENESLRKFVIGAGAAGLGAGIAKVASPELDAWSQAAGGPNAMLTAFGQHAARGGDRGQEGGTIMQKMWGEFPLIAENVSVNPLERMIPSGVRDIAQAMDPAFNREKGFGTVADASVREGGDPSFLARTGRALMAGPQARIPGLREGLPERPNPVDNAGNLKFPERRGFALDITLRNFTSPVKILDAVTLPKIMVGNPTINPPDYPNDPTGQYLQNLERQTMRQGTLMKPPTLQEDPELRDIEALGGPHVQPIDRDIRKAGLKAKGQERWDALTALVNEPEFREMSKAEQSLVVRDILSELASSGVSKDVSELTSTSTISPEDRAEILIALQELGAR
jgi:hypothetical protein